MSGGLRIGVVGVGYVGLTTAVCLAGRDHDVVAVDIDEAKIARLSAGVPIIDEADLPDLLTRTIAAGRLTFRTDYEALADRDVVFVCVSTPSGPDGAADLRALDAAVTRLTQVLRAGAVVTIKSTVPVGTTRRVAKRLRAYGIGAVSSPEFLREGRAIADFTHPDRVVVGADSDTDAALVCAAYGADPATVLHMSPESAELAKYASNAFLAVKLSYTNSLAQLCRRYGGDIGDVTACMGADARIGPSFLQPGPGWGGSCLPKDTAALVFSAQAQGVAMAEVEAARTTNVAQPARIEAALRQSMTCPLRDARITVLGLTFKAATSDTRDSPALAVCAHLAAEGAALYGYDPRLPAIDATVLSSAGVTAVDDPYRAAKSADAVVVLTEWPQFRDLDWAAIAEHAPGAVVADTRNLLDPTTVEAAGLRYLGNGRADGY
ncbi:UDP-glucose 6-dehydrogenase [Mycolicibacterium chubuense]|uniref:UDP-glucose 6-dehydrogenase n=1 Tax=Mycolicibacterium chubuense TaxID=1800 RepID=A0A0J6WNC4_MYCCU|nr:UDP-glucose/GDP-mannose dehydrogenase family protein [Mycolicibacterium chubuense]KMO83197.1 UDP-glucose 6-dehydrogenase TuaD [Mycolicibacterium chubuense]ORA43767.1 UDP-glucose 6-dehydrogenase [Mycolicibacterium chubuense]SPX95962.1 UDP-glucose 6-dehydrogenase [Mycolicibacterium chubuense]